MSHPAATSIVRSMHSPPHANPPRHVADRLIDAVERAGAPACVGIDPVIERLPEALQTASNNRQESVDSIAAFSLGVLDAVVGRVGVVKFQSACFERYGHVGIAALEKLTSEAGERGLEVILDSKRGDISISAEHYAAAAFDRPASGPDGRPDWVTIHSYLGADGITPFLARGGGAFALVRTTNPSGDAVQGRRLADGRTVAETIAEMIAVTGRSALGEYGYSALGAVVGATRPEEAARLRKLMPQQIFLVPGFGAQGGTDADVRPCFGPNGRGAIVAASRSVIYAFDPGQSRWAASVSDAAEELAEQVGRAAGMR